MNVQEAGLHVAVAERTSELFSPDRSSFRQRTAAVARAAAAEVEDVDREARFPQKAFDAVRQERLLGVQIPTEFGGDGALISDITDMCYTLGRACASTAMIFAMHQTKCPPRGRQQLA
jgi:acyl-CoA dehydrogenase